MENAGVYILLCNNGRYYVGSAGNLSRRVDEHNNGKVKSTRYVRPLKLIAFIPCNTLTDLNKI